MPSGNAIYTYTGKEPEVTIQGQVFLKDQPKHITDQGVIAVCAAREDFSAFDIAHAVFREDVDFAESYDFRSVTSKSAGVVLTEDHVGMTTEEVFAQARMQRDMDEKLYTPHAKPKKAKSK